MDRDAYVCKDFEEQYILPWEHALNSWTLGLDAPFLCRSLTDDDDDNDDDDDDDGDVGLRVLGCRVDILGTNCNTLTEPSLGQL